MPAPLRSLALAVLVSAAVWPLAGFAFHYVKPGDVVADQELPRCTGGKESFLGKGKVGVFVFFDSSQKHSAEGLSALARIEKELAGKPVHWAAIVSDRCDEAEVKAMVKTTGIAMPVLVDTGDALYGRLGAALTPVAGIVDSEHKLVAYVHFRKIGFHDAVLAWTRRALGEITDEELQQVLNPPAATQGGEQQVARRYLRMGERLLKAQDVDGALVSARKSVSHDGTLAAAHSLVAAILALQGKCSEAAVEIDAALALDAKDERALETRKTCGGSGAAAPPADAGK